MRTYKIEQVQQRRMETCVCNRCGNSCEVSIGADNDGEPRMDNYGTGIVATGGYSSTHLCDMAEYSCDLCEACLAWLFGTFKIPVSVNETDLAGAIYGTDASLYEALRITAVGRGETPPTFEQWQRSRGKATL